MFKFIYYSIILISYVKIGTLKNWLKNSMKLFGLSEGSSDLILRAAATVMGASSGNCAFLRKRIEETLPKAWE